MKPVEATNVWMPSSTPVEATQIAAAARYAAELRWHPERRSLIDPVRSRLFRDSAEFAQYGAEDERSGKLLDFMFGVETEPHRPNLVFPRLRWGGQYTYITRDRRTVADLPALFAQRGYVIVQPLQAMWRPVMGWSIPFLGPRLHYFTARKVNLIQPRQVTERFTYDVQLVPGEDGELVVCKSVPTQQRVVARLHKRFPTVPLEVIEKRARKFTDKIFPLFLTREAAFLKILQEHLPERYRQRVPRILGLERDERGYVRQLRMTWLRNGGKPLPHLEFARQAADLLRALHDHAEVIHLDLRLDNVVITEKGVGFVDFGSAVRVGENVASNPLLGTLFEELMRTSQIQRMLEKMTNEGSVTSSVINNGYQRVDKAVDLFYLAVQFNSPHINPDLVDLIEFDPRSAHAQSLSELTRQILKPADPHNPPYKSAQDILGGIERIVRRGFAAA